MKHPFLTDKKYKFGALFILVFILLTYLVSFTYDDFMFANIFTGIMVTVLIVAYFKLKR